MALSVRFAPVLTDEQLATVAQLAREIWYEYYVPLIGRAQVDYMVARIQSLPAMRTQREERYEYFLIEQETPAPATPIGYFAIRADPDASAIFLSKLYLLASARGTGIGRRALNFVESVARKRGLRRVWLTVNKGNPARFVYERAGYENTGALVTDIGGGFVMDDYRMEKILT